VGSSGAPAMQDRQHVVWTAEVARVIAQGVEQGGRLEASAGVGHAAEQGPLHDDDLVSRAARLERLRLTVLHRQT